MTTTTKKAPSYDQLDAILDFAYGQDARRQATRERNITIARFLKKKSVRDDEKAGVCEAA